jgi:probable selenium-dependent hydroxylase accessory protein YqeC
MVALRDALGVGDREIVAFVGAGGKTTALFRLARELRAGGATVVVTTTTRILVPEPSPDLRVIVEPQRSTLVGTAMGAIAPDHVMVVAREVTTDGKLAGVPPDWVRDLADLRGVTHVLVEADGAARKPFKAPREGEPVIPATATVVVAVVGIDALGRPLSEVAHRPEEVTALTGLGPAEAIDVRTIASVLLDPMGIARGTPKDARLVILVNKADDPRRVEQAGALAAELLRGGAGRIVIATLEADDAIVEVLGPS